MNAILYIINIFLKCIFQQIQNKNCRNQYLYRNNKDDLGKPQKNLFLVVRPLRPQIFKKNVKKSSFFFSGRALTHPTLLVVGPLTKGLFFAASLMNRYLSLCVRRSRPPNRTIMVKVEHLKDQRTFKLKFKFLHRLYRKKKCLLRIV